ncbi:hypothetical protein NFI95_10570 [Acetobacteraceae bacterium KSS8]|uniref:DUF2946 domain-containing protein n=1 Tax=Endosaccharibacter trunci TaxID=2812733 RepID=A0ABT1W7N0_9PROT|nr:hypothetical protein [Acetobacteraceae bacterium KSS8]
MSGSIAPGRPGRLSPSGRRHSHPRRAGLGVVAAVLAVVVLSWAGVQSALMQMAAIVPEAMHAAMEMAAPDSMPDCPDMMRAAAPADDAHGPADKRKPARDAPCPICSIAAHLPVPVALPAIIARRVVHSVRFLPGRDMQPRGPPMERPRARGPPPPVFMS